MGDRHGIIIQPEGDSLSVAKTCSGQHWWSGYSADFLCRNNSGLPTSAHWIPNDKFRLFICNNVCTYTRLCPLIQKIDQCAVSLFAYRQGEMWGKVLLGKKAVQSKKKKSVWSVCPQTGNFQPFSLAELSPFWKEAIPLPAACQDRHLGREGRRRGHSRYGIH